MPIYSFQCKECQAIFDLRATFQEKEAGLHPECPGCHSQEVQQVITAGMVLHSAGGGSSSLPSCGCGSKSGCCS